MCKKNNLFHHFCPSCNVNKAVSLASHLLVRTALKIIPHTDPASLSGPSCWGRASPAPVPAMQTPCGGSWSWPLLNCTRPPTVSMKNRAWKHRMSLCIGVVLKHLFQQVFFECWVFACTDTAVKQGCVRKNTHIALFQCEEGGRCELHTSAAPSAASQQIWDPGRLSQARWCVSSLPCLRTPLVAAAPGVSHHCGARGCSPTHNANQFDLKMGTQIVQIFRDYFFKKRNFILVSGYLSSLSGTLAAQPVYFTPF